MLSPTMSRAAERQSCEGACSVLYCCRGLIIPEAMSRRWRCLSSTSSADLAGLSNPHNSAAKVTVVVHLASARRLTPFSRVLPRWKQQTLRPGRQVVEAGRCGLRGSQGPWEARRPNRWLRLMAPLRPTHTACDVSHSFSRY